MSLVGTARIIAPHSSSSGFESDSQNQMILATWIRTERTTQGADLQGVARTITHRNLKDCKQVGYA